MNSEKREHKLSEKEREYFRNYQYKYYHEKVKLKVACELCGSKTTAKNLVTHKRTPKCKNLSRGRQETFSDRVEQLELLVGKLSLNRADSLVCMLSESSASTASE